MAGHILVVPGFESPGLGTDRVRASYIGLRCVSISTLPYTFLLLIWTSANKTQLMDPIMKTVTATIATIELVPTTKLVTATLQVTQTQMVTVAVCLSHR